MADGVRWDDEAATGTAPPTLTRPPAATTQSPTAGITWDDQKPQPAPALKAPSTADHSTLGDLGRRALGAAATGAGELVQAYGDIGQKVEQALPFTATLHRAQGITPQGVQDVAKGIENYGERESANVSPEYAKKTSVGLTAPGGLSLTNLADKAVTTVAGMAPALAGTAIASLAGPEVGVPVGATLFGAQGEAGGRNAGEQQVAALTDQQLQQIPAYQNYLKSGLTPAQARAKFSEDVANRQALVSGGFGAGLGLVGEIPGVNAAGKAIASKLVRPIGARAAQAIGKGVAEGAGFAGINAAGQVVNNVTNPIHTPATQGVGEAAASGLLPGFVLGGARGALTRPTPTNRAADTGAAGTTGPEPHPGAAPGSLSDAANVLHRTAPSPEPVQPAADTTTTTQGDGLRLRVEPIAVPWVDKATGEVTPPTDNQVLAALHAMRDQADAIKANGNKPTMSTPQVAAAWGIAPDRLRKLQSAMTAERRKGVTTSDAEARAAQEPQLPIEPENPVDTLRASGAAQNARLRDLQGQLDQTGETLAGIRARLEAHQQTGGSEIATSNDVAKPEPVATKGAAATPSTAAPEARTLAPDKLAAIVQRWRENQGEPDAKDVATIAQMYRVPIADVKAARDRTNPNAQTESTDHVEQPEPQQPATSSASGGTGRASSDAAAAPDVEVRTTTDSAQGTAARAVGTGEDAAGKAKPVATPPATESDAARAGSASGSAEQPSALPEPAAKAAEPATAQGRPPAAAPKPAEPKPTPKDETTAVAEQPAPSAPASEPVGPAAEADQVPSAKASKQPVSPETTANVGEKQATNLEKTPNEPVYSATLPGKQKQGVPAAQIEVAKVGDGYTVRANHMTGMSGHAAPHGRKYATPEEARAAGLADVEKNLVKKPQNAAEAAQVEKIRNWIASERAKLPTAAEPTIENAARESAAHPENEHPKPTPAQHDAGNFKMGHVNLHGLDVTIQVPKGGTRRGTDQNGKPWERPASDHYGHIRRTEGADGEQVDVYLGPHAEDPKANVFVIDQVKPGTKTFDEHKAMVGFKTGKDARASYDRNFPKGLKTFGGIRKMSMDEFKDWVKHGDTTKPVSDQLAPARKSQPGPVEPGPVAATKPKPQPSANTIFTEDAAAKARAILKAKLGQLSSGVDPEIMQAGITLAGYHIEKGARTFAAYAKAMLDDLGEQVRPYLKSWYMGVKYDPRAADFKDMSSAAEVESHDLGKPAATGPKPLETKLKQAETTAKETAHDTAAQNRSAQVDTPVSDRPAPEGVRGRTPDRGAQLPRGADRQGDAARVRAARADGHGSHDEEGNVGNGTGPALVPDRPSGDLARGAGQSSAHDFRASPADLTRAGSWFDTAKRNLDLIDLARKIEAEGRAATPEEQAQLAKYTGFGAGEIRNNIFPVPGQWAKQRDPERLIWPDIAQGRWKELAQRADALPREWQQSILQSTQYAHYTSPSVVRSMWDALQRLGFTGGRVLEPGSGIGSFPMLMPDVMRESSRFTGVEFDEPTAMIARLLSPQQDMLHADFIKRNLPRDFYDVAIGNPPFSRTRIVADPEYARFKFALHDYFFAKAMDRVRPGGVLAFVTSHFTMDKQGAKARRYLAERADLLGAIRLPSTAFEANAGTSVVADVLFLRKRAQGEEPAGYAWTDIAQVETKDGPVQINQYFAEHPEMVLGQHRIGGNTDDEGRRINSNGYGGGQYTVVSYDKTPAELDAKFAKAVENLPANTYSALSASPDRLRAETAKIDFDPKVRREGVVYTADDGTLMRVAGGVGKPLADSLKLSPKDTAWLKSYVGVRDLVNHARLTQVSDGDWQGALQALNKAYDAHVKAHGPILDYRELVRKSTDEDGNPVESSTRVFKNRRLFREDYDAALVTSLETIGEDGKIGKSKFLRDRTIGTPVTRDVKTIGDALAVSLDETGALHLDDVAQRLNISRDEAIDALGNQIYRTPKGDWALADDYLSGDVVQKLADAEVAARHDPAYQRNVEALKKIQPEKLGPSQISVKLGASWVPEEYVNTFASEIGAGAVTFDPTTETWQVEGGNKRSERSAAADYGTAARSPSELLEAALNSRSVTVKTRVPNGDTGTKEVTDTEATDAANEKISKIRDKFKSWVWSDTDRATDLVDRYNRQFNNIAPRRFDGSHLTLPGVSLKFNLHPHVKTAIWRQVQTGNTYLAHAVGAGKTIEMIAGGMEQKRLGLIKKPMYVVPNHMLEQFSNEFMELYPLANIMVADDQNFSRERRKAFVAAATLNAPDAVVITHSAFERVGVKEETIAPIRDEMLRSLEEELDDTGRDQRVRRSQLQQQIEAVNQRFDSILAAGKKDSTLNFEDIGADFLYVDEAHAYRKLDFSTNQNIKGIDPNGSRRALDMYVKTQYLNRERPGRAMVFASGTPVTNTMGELYTIMRFFAPEELAKNGISTFDSWARQFGEAKSELEANAAGRYEAVTRFSKFDNVPELMSRVRQFMDVLTSEHLGALIKRPDLEGGKPNLVLVPPTQALKDYMKNVLEPRLEASRAWKPSKDQPFNPDPVLAIISDGRFAALDPRFVGGTIKPGETSKLIEMADRIAAQYKATARNKYTDAAGKDDPLPGSAQIVFYNFGFGAGARKNRGFDARKALTDRLVQGGVKRDDIAWFDDANTDAKKEAIFKAVRSGQIRVLIGSAKKMGTGVNVQKRLITLHYFDPPWYPSDVEQPHGRILRYGNQNPKVGIDWYSTKGTYDSTMWQMVGRKQRFIDQAFSGDKSLRSMEDVSEASLYEQAAALASGDPRALQLAGLRQDVERFERLQAAHASEQVNVASELNRKEWEVGQQEKRVAMLDAAHKAMGAQYIHGVEAKVGGRPFDKAGDFGAAVKQAFNRIAAGKPTKKDITIGTFHGHEIEVVPQLSHRDDLPTGNYEVVLAVGKYKARVLDAAAGLDERVDDVGLGRRFTNRLNAIGNDLENARGALKDAQTDVVRLKKKKGAPFEYQQELAEKHRELTQLEAELRAEGEAEAAAAKAARDGSQTAPSKSEAAGGGFARVAPGSGRAPRGVPRDVVQQAVDRATAEWSGNKPAIKVLADADELPASAKRDLTYGDAQGYYDPETKTAYLIAANLDSPQHALRVLAHEAVGHHGVEHVVDDAFGANAWQGVQNAIARLKQSGKASRDMQSVLDETTRRYAGSDPGTFAKEFLAVSAERGVKNALLDRVVAAVRAFVRKIMPGLRLSEAELRQLVVSAERFLRAGGEAGAPAAFFNARNPLGRLPGEVPVNPTAPNFGFVERHTLPEGHPLLASHVADNSPERQALRQRLVDQAFEGHSPVPGDQRPAALVMGGGGASGKSSVKKALARNGEIPPDAVQLDPDEFKSGNPDTGRAGLPEYAQIMAAGDTRAAQVVHDESTLLYNAALKRAIAGRYNLVLDRTMSNPGKADAEIRALKKAGYYVHHVGVTVPMHEALARSSERSQETPNSRLVPAPDLIKAHRGYSAGGLHAVNVRADRTDLYDNFVPRDVEAVKIASGGAGRLKILDKKRYNLFREKAHANAKASRFQDLATQGLLAVQDQRGLHQRDQRAGLQPVQGTDVERLAGSSQGIGRGSPDVASGAVPSPQGLKDQRLFSRPQAANDEPSDPSREPHKTVKDIEAVLRHGDPAGVRDKAKAWLRGKLEDFRPAMLGAIQTRHLLELMEDSPPLKGSGKNYERSMQQMDADRQQLMAGAPDAAEHPNDMLKKGAVTIAQEMRQYAYGKGLRALRGRVRPEAQKLFDMMHAATIQRMDPDKAYERLTIENAHGDAVPWTHEEVKARLKLLKELALQRGGDAWADREKIRDEVRYLRNIAKMERARERNWPKLQADWQALPEEAKSLYRQVRDWYSQYRDETEKALIKNIEALDMPETYRRSLVNRMRLRFEEARREGVYFPLNRDGAFWIAFRDVEGNEGFKMFESAREFERGEKRLRAAGFQIDAKGRRDQNLQARDAPSGTFVRQVIDVLQQAKVSESVQDEVYQTFLRSLPELSMRKHAIHRKNIAGYSEDALRAFAKNGYHGAHQLARLRHAQDMGFALEAMRASVDNWRRGENSTDTMKEPGPLAVAKADALVGEMAKRHDWIMHPTDQRLANMVNSLGFIYYLGASPASALTNLTQVAQTVLPVLGAEHGWGKATRMVGAAWRDAARTVGHMDRTLKDPDERRAFMVMQQRGDFSKTQSHTLAGLAEGNVLQTSPAWSRGMNAISWLFHTAEVINRESTGMAAYRLARAKGMDFQKAVEYAGKINADANFDYAAANRPRYMQGNVQRIALQFKNYSVGMSWLFYRNLFQAMKGETPEIRRVARRTVTGILGMTAILAGATGLPVYNAVKMTANAANTLWGDDNEPWNFDDAFHRWLADNLGPDAARLIAEGPTNYLTGANLASRTSLANLWIHDDDQRLEGADAYHALLENLAGPIGGIVNNWYVGVEDVRRGHLERGVERMLPTAVKNSIKSLRYAHEGVNSLRGDPIVPDVSGWQDFLQAVGFEPAAVANQYRINTAMKNYTSEIGDRRINLMNAYALAMKGGDDADLGAALRKINAFNAAHPEVAITAPRLRASLRQRARLSAQAKNGVVLNKRLALQAQQYAGVAQ